MEHRRILLLRRLFTSDNVGKRLRDKNEQPKMKVKGRDELWTDNEFSNKSGKQIFNEEWGDLKRNIKDTGDNILDSTKKVMKEGAKKIQVAVKKSKDFVVGTASGISKQQNDKKKDE